MTIFEPRVKNRLCCRLGHVCIEKEDVKEDPRDAPRDLVDGAIFQANDVDEAASRRIMKKITRTAFQKSRVIILLLLSCCCLPWRKFMVVSSKER